MKIILAPLNTIVGDIDYNTGRILEFIEKSKCAGADLVVFPELTLVGYPPRDLLLQKDIIDNNLRALKKVAAASCDIGVIVGFVDRNPAPEGKGLFNAAALCSDGKILSKHYKTLLPYYDIFDEGRYFDPAPCVSIAEFRGKKIAVTICEDIWNFDPGEGRQRLYGIDPIPDLVAQGPDFIINLSASPYSLGKRKFRVDVIKDCIRRSGKPLFHVNLVGGNDSIIFDGWSAVFSEKGELLAESSDFKEDMLFFDTDEINSESHKSTSPGMERLLEALKLGLYDYVKKCGFKKTVLGLSGGMDSALVAYIAAKALGPENVVAISMPSRFSSEGSKDDAEKLARNLGIEYRKIPIESPFVSFLKLLEPEFEGRPFDVAEENIQARIRGVILMALSNKFGWLVLSTGNKSELAMGYCTLYGDMSGGLSVISDVPKTIVYELAEYINHDKEIIPRAIIDKPPSAELRPNQKDQDSLPPYEILDPIISEFIEERKCASEIAKKLGHEKEFVRKILYTISKNEYKRRQAAPGLKVTSQAFGEGWRMPIAAKWCFDFAQQP
jgi:NAD+ synthase (glutamine-hydrolysing)